MAEMDITFTVSDPDLNDVLDELNRVILSDSEKLRPARLTVDTPYAEYVEYGTGPMRTDKSAATDGKGDESKGKWLDNIREWVRAKQYLFSDGGKLSESDIRRIAYHIWKNQMEHGMPAQPYFRPALYSVLDHLPDNYFDDDRGTVFNILLDVATKMEDILEENNTVYTGLLKDSIEVDYAYDVIETMDVQSLSRMTKVSGTNDSLFTDDEGLTHIGDVNRYKVSRRSLSGKKGTYARNQAKALAKARGKKNGSTRLPRGALNNQGIRSKGPNKRNVWNNAQGRKRR